jgi:hypothetical protein
MFRKSAPIFIALFIGAIIIATIADSQVRVFQPYNFSNLPYYNLGELNNLRLLNNFSNLPSNLGELNNLGNLNNFSNLSSNLGELNNFNRPDTYSFTPQVLAKEADTRSYTSLSDSEREMRELLNEYSLYPNAVVEAAITDLRELDLYKYNEGREYSVIHSVKKFQEKYDLPVDGKLTKTTRNRLHNKAFEHKKAMIQYFVRDNAADVDKLVVVKKAVNF